MCSRKEATRFSYWICQRMRGLKALWVFKAMVILGLIQLVWILSFALTFCLSHMIRITIRNSLIVSTSSCLTHSADLRTNYKQSCSDLQPILTMILSRQTISWFKRSSRAPRKEMMIQITRYISGPSFQISSLDQKCLHPLTWGLLKIRTRLMKKKQINRIKIKNTWD